MKLIHHERGRDALYKIWNAPEENMIIYFHSGSGSLVFQDAIYPIEAGGIYFIKGSKPRYTMPDNPVEYDRSKIYLPKEKTAAILGALEPESEFYKLFSSSSVVYARIPLSIESTVDGFFQKAMVDKDCPSKDAKHIISFFSLLEMIFTYKQHHIKSPDGLMARAVEYVNMYYYEPITLDGICKHLNISKSYLCHSFKRAIGITVSEYILKTRLAAAKSLLISSELSIGEISNRCGFSSVSYFCQAFRAAQGVSAKEYRKGNLK